MTEMPYTNNRSKDNNKESQDNSTKLENLIEIIMKIRLWGRDCKVCNKFTIIIWNMLHLKMKWWHKEKKNWEKNNSKKEF